MSTTRSFDREHRKPFGREFRTEYREPAMYVTDFIESGNPADRHVEHRTQPLAQGVGVKFFSLLEATPLPAIKLFVLERVELDQHSKVRRIIRVSYDDLTSLSKTHLPEAVELIVKESEKTFVEFFNIVAPINIRFHALELFPHIGKKTVRTIIEERSKRRFESFQDFRERIGIDPVKVLVERIVKEIIGGEKYYMFVKPQPKDQQAIYLGYLERLYGLSIA